MKFREWLLTEKFMSLQSHFCELCHGYLYPKEIVFNPRHVYSYGQLHRCQCGKSRVWANAPRNENKLIAFFKGQEDRYYQGFCNDPYCGFCITKYLYPLKNGVPSPLPHINFNLDKWGCTECDNQHILVHGQAEHKEGDTEHLMRWYKSHMGDLIRAIRKQEGEDAI